MHVLLEDMLMCLINVMNDSHCLRYIHADRQTIIQQNELKAI
jgi:hypothetical protein